MFNSSLNFPDKKSAGEQIDQTRWNYKQMKDFISKETAVDSEILKFDIKQVHYHHKIIIKPSVGLFVWENRGIVGRVYKERRVLPMAEKC